MTELACQDHGSTGTTDGVCTEAVLKKHTLAGESINVGSRIDALEPSVVRPDGMTGMIVTENENDVWPSIICHHRANWIATVRRGRKDCQPTNQADCYPTGIHRFAPQSSFNESHTPHRIIVAAVRPDKGSARLVEGRTRCSHHLAGMIKIFGSDRPSKTVTD
jgi:hypothetical protein